MDAKFRKQHNYDQKKTKIHKYPLKKDQVVQFHLRLKTTNDKVAVRIWYRDYVTGKDTVSPMNMFKRSIDHDIPSNLVSSLGQA
jgi:hypothetical protein